MDDELSFGDRLQHGWNAFRNKDPSIFSTNAFTTTGTALPTSTYRQYNRKPLYSVDPTMVNTILNRISVDVSEAVIEHIRTDEEGRYLEDMDSGLNKILNLEANIDQTGQAFMLDIVRSLLDDGVVAVVPVDTVVQPISSIGSNDIITARVGRIINWGPATISVEVYDERDAARKTIVVPKSTTAIIENPFYEIMNEPNSILRRLNRRLAILDDSDDHNASSKLDMIIQLPYVVRGKTREGHAKRRRDELVQQLNDSEYGIAYADGTEKIIQLNRAIESNIMPQIEYLTEQLYNRLGLTPEIMNQTATEQTMTNYYRRIVDPILNAIVNEFKRKFLTKTARSQHQTIWWHREPFAFTTTSVLAEVADKFTRNEILSPNEVRSAIAYKPKRDGKSDELRNRNINQSSTEVVTELPGITDEVVEVGTD